MNPPAEKGMALTDIDTPALVIDLDAFERNLARMAEALKDAPVRLRAHAKTHKSTIISQKQMALGAVGACCQKVSEAEILVRGGVPNVLVSNEVIGEHKPISSILVIFTHYFNHLSHHTKAEKHQ